MRFDRHRDLPGGPPTVRPAVPPGHHQPPRLQHCQGMSSRLRGSHWQCKRVTIMLQTNLYTVAPNVSGALMLLILAFASDLTRLRFPFIALGFLLTFIGFIIYVAIDVQTKLHVAYFACFMMTWGTSAPSVILDVWYNNNIADENRRVMLTSVGVPVANLMGVVSSNIFRNQDAPKYIPALATTAAFGGLGCILTLILGAWMIADNKRRDIKQGQKLLAKDIPTELLKDGPAVPEYRWFL
jgi:hypothetical protein